MLYAVLLSSHMRTVRYVTHSDCRRPALQWQKDLPADRHHSAAADSHSAALPVGAHHQLPAPRRALPAQRRGNFADSQIRCREAPDGWRSNARQCITRLAVPSRGTCDGRGAARTSRDLHTTPSSLQLPCHHVDAYHRTETWTQHKSQLLVRRNIDPVHQPSFAMPTHLNRSSCVGCAADPFVLPPPSLLAQ